MVSKQMRAFPWHWWAFAALVAVELLGVVTHSMWCDEMQQWNIAKASGTLADLFRNLRYEGHPWLWYLLIWPLSKVSGDPAALKSLHFALALATAVLVMLKAPFRRSVRLLLVAGYFLSFEYVVIVRSYVLAPLTAFAWCAWGARTAERPVRSAALLGLLANTSVYGAMLSLVLAAGEALDIRRPESPRPSGGPEGPRASLPLARFCGVFVPLFAVAFATMAFKEGGGVAWSVQSGYRQELAGFAENLVLVGQALLPVPRPVLGYWNSSPFWWPSAPFLSAALFVGVLAGACAVLRGSRRALRLFLLLAAGLVLFQQFVYPGALRHNGVLFVGFVVLLWTRHPAPATDGGGATDGSWARPLLAGLLCAQAVAGAMAAGLHLRHPFSMGREAARLLRSAGLEGYPIVAHADYAAVPVAGYLDRPLHFASTGRPGTFVRWSDAERDWRVSVDGVVSFARRVAETEGRPVYLLLNNPVSRPDLDVLFVVAGSTVAEEQYFVYALLPEEAG